MIRLEPVMERSFRAVVDMKLPPEQGRFVAPNVVSLAQAWLYYDEARPMAIWADDTVVGFLMLDWDEGERTLGIWRFMIASEQQKKGYGRAALRLTIELARNSGKFDLVHLDYLPGNDAARALYRSLGFRENGEIEDGEIVMTLPLTTEPKVGALVADADDMDDFAALIESEHEAGREMPRALMDEERLKALVETGKVVRLTLMGKTIGLSAEGELLLANEYADRRTEATERLARME